MIEFDAMIEKFGKKGEKTGWTYIALTALQSEVLKPNCKTSYRVKGKIDLVEIAGMATVPMGDGEFIIALKKELVKKLDKTEGQWVSVAIKEHIDFTIEMPDDLYTCLADDPEILAKFELMPRSHQHYYFNWLNTAKTIPTRTKRIIMIFHAMQNNLDFGAMLRNARNNPIL